MMCRSLNCLRVQLLSWCWLALAFIPAGPLRSAPTHHLAGPGSGSLYGRVTEKGKNLPVAGASVYIPDLKLGTIADTSGNYQFKSLPSGTYLVEVRSVGFKTLTMSVNINGPTQANFEMSDEYVEESQVVVTGLSKATQIKRSPVPIVSVNHQFIVANLSSNIIDAIAKVPGVNALTTGPNISKPFIRGLGYNRILSLFDGIRQEGQQWGDEHGIEVDQYGIDHIEIVKGPASLTYGSDALAGVVNLIPTPPAPEGKIEGDVLAEYQSNNGLFGGSAMLSGTKKGFEWMGRLSHKQATNYQNPVDGRVYNTAFNETDGSAFFGLHRDWGYSHLGLSVFDDLQEIPDGSRDSTTRQFTKQITNIDTFRPIVTPQQLVSYAMTPLHQHVQYYRAYSANDFILGDGRLVVNLAFTRSVRREYDKPQEPDLAGLFLQLNTYSYDVKYYFPEFQGWSLTGGVNGMYQDNTVTKGTNFVIPSYHQFDVGPFLMAKKTFGKLDLVGGARFDSRYFKNFELYTTTDSSTLITTPVYGADTVGADKVFSNYTHNFSGLSGSLGATYNFTEKLSVKANIARGYRAPNIAEISANGVHPGTNIYQIGNPNFLPEFSLQEDIGFAFSSKYLVINFAVFNNTISNYIFNEKLLSVNGGDSVIVPGNQTFKYQQGKAELYGGEVSVDLHPIRAIHFLTVLSAVYGINLDIPAAQQSDSNKYVPMMPPLHGLSEISYNFDYKAYHVVNAFVKVQFAYYAKQDRVYLVNNTETPTSCYNLVNVGLGCGITNAKGRLLFNVYLMGNNIFDVAYQDHLSRLKYFEPYPTEPVPHHGIYNEGKNFGVKVDFPLEFAYK